MVSVHMLSFRMDQTGEVDYGLGEPKGTGHLRLHDIALADSPIVSATLTGTQITAAGSFAPSSLMALTPYLRDSGSWTRSPLRRGRLPRGGLLRCDPSWPRSPA
jgi:hypothetical protein